MRLPQAGNSLPLYITLPVFAALTGLPSGAFIFIPSFLLPEFLMPKVAITLPLVGHLKIFFTVTFLGCFFFVLLKPFLQFLVSAKYGILIIFPIINFFAFKFLFLCLRSSTVTKEHSAILMRVSPFFNFIFLIIWQQNAFTRL